MAVHGENGGTVAVCISYCSHERPFIRAVLRQSLLFSRVVVVAVGARLFSGLPEDEEHIAALRTEFKGVSFIRYPVNDRELTTPVVLHNRSRETALQVVRQLVGAGEAARCSVRHSGDADGCSGDADGCSGDADGCARSGRDDVWVLMLDGDEVPEGAAFGAWWTAAHVCKDVAYKMANHWYFLDPLVRAESLEDSVVLIHLRHLTPAALSHPRERDGVLAVAGALTGLTSTARRVVAVDGAPMFHHFSWVRSPAALFAKVATWGHAGDRTDWRQLVERGLAELGEGRLPREFVHGYQLRRISSLPEEVRPEMG